MSATETETLKRLREQLAAMQKALPVGHPDRKEKLVIEK